MSMTKFEPYALPCFPVTVKLPEQAMLRRSFKSAVRVLPVCVVVYKIAWSLLQGFLRYFSFFLPFQVTFWFSKTPFPSYSPIVINSTPAVDPSLVVAAGPTSSRIHVPLKSHLETSASASELLVSAVDISARTPFDRVRPIHASASVINQPQLTEDAFLHDTISTFSPVGFSAFMEFLPRRPSAMSAAGSLTSIRSVDVPRDHSLLADLRSPDISNFSLLLPEANELVDSTFLAPTAEPPSANFVSSSSLVESLDSIRLPYSPLIPGLIRDRFAISQTLPFGSICYTPPLGRHQSPSIGSTCSTPI